MSTIRLSGSHTLVVQKETIWPMIFNPAILVQLIPGCQELRQVSEEVYEGVIRVGFAGYSGSYSTLVRVLEIAPPDFCRFEGEIRGKTGTIKGEAAFRIEDRNGYSQVTYTATGVITGALSQISPRFIEGAVNSMIKLGLVACEKRLRPVSPDPP